MILRDPHILVLRERERDTHKVGKGGAVITPTSKGHSMTSLSIHWYTTVRSAYVYVKSAYVYVRSAYV